MSSVESLGHIEVDGIHLTLVKNHRRQIIKKKCAEVSFDWIAPKKSKLIMTYILVEIKKKSYHVQQFRKQEDCLVSIYNSNRVPQFWRHDWLVSVAVAAASLTSGFLMRVNKVRLSKKM